MEVDMSASYQASRTHCAFPAKNPKPPATKVMSSGRPKFAPGMPNKPGTSQGGTKK